MQNTTELNNKPKRFIYDFNPEETEITMQTKDLEIYYGKNLAMHNADLKFKKNTITALDWAFRVREINLFTVTQSNE